MTAWAQFMRVVVTGMGLVSALGHDLTSSWQAVLAGQSAVRTYLNDPTLHNQQPLNLALVSDFPFSSWKVSHAPSRLASFLGCASSQALSHAQLDTKKVDLRRGGICVGSLGCSLTRLSEMMQESHSDHYRNIHRLSMLQMLSSMPAATLNVEYSFKGPALTVSTACASGLSAIVEAAKWVRLGEADFVLAGASEDVYNPLYLNSSLRLQAMTTKVYPTPSQASRPFDTQRSGFVLGEGAGMLVVESLQHAQARGAPIIAEVLGHGCTTDGFHLVRPESSGEGQIRAMRLALSSSGLRPSEVRLVSAHATSTPTGDEIEARAIMKVFEGCSPWVSAVKSNLGHCFAAAGAVETILGLMSLQESRVPRILNLEHPQVKGLSYALEQQTAEIDVMLKNSFGFGGVNVSCIFRKYRP